MADHSLGLQSLHDEAGPTELKTEGSFPDWLSGSLLRTGPALLEVEDSRYNHWFDGLAMLYRFAFEDGRVSYSNRFLRSRAFERAQAEGRIVYGEFGTSADRGLLGNIRRLTGGLGESHNANVSVINRSDGAFALTETPTQMQFDPETLETVGPAAFRDKLQGQVTTAHPHTDAERQVQVNYLLEFGRKSSIHVYEHSLSGRQRRLIGSVPVDKPAYMHSFGMTHRYVILMEPPLRVSPLKLRFSLKPFIANYEWDESEGVRFHVMDRSDGSVVTAEGDTCFAFHQVNAFEDGEEVVIDLCAYPDASIVGALKLDNLRGEATAGVQNRLLRYRIPKRGGTARVELISPEFIELPRINEGALAGRRYGDLWGTSKRAPESPFFDRLVRIDANDGNTAAVWEEDHCFPTEPLFVPRPGAERDSGGIVLSVILNAADESSSLVALDAETLDELGRARLPHVVPFHFHGRHFDAPPLQSTAM